MKKKSRSKQEIQYIYIYIINIKYYSEIRTIITFELKKKKNNPIRQIEDKLNIVYIYIWDKMKKKKKNKEWLIEYIVGVYSNIYHLKIGLWKKKKKKWGLLKFQKKKNTRCILKL